MIRPRIERLDAAAVAALQQQLARFERGFTYPLGSDRFRIDHGVDYLAFFRGLGEPVTHVAKVDGALAGVLVVVRRLLPEPTWYVCDLKVAPAFAGMGLARALLSAFARDHLAAEPRAFGVSMDDAAGANRMVRLARRCREARVEDGPTLGVHSLDFATWERVAPLLRRSLGPLHLYDPHGRKDIVLVGTGAPLPLLHVQHGPLARPESVPPRPDATFMFCLPERDPLALELEGMGVSASGTASVLHVGMQGFDWRLVLTSDI